MKLRTFKQKDAEGMLEWMHSENTKKIFFKDFNSYTLEDVKNYIKIKNTKENINYACVDDNDDYLGSVSLKNIDLKNKNAEYAISFRETAQGTGAAMYATKEILRIAFEELQLEKVYLDVLETNKRARGFYKKIGFVEEGISRNHIIKENKYINIIWLSMLKEEYNSWKNSQ